MSDREFTRKYIKKLKETSFLAYFENGEEIVVGDSNPRFKLIVNKYLKEKDMQKNTSLALFEAYMNGDIEIDKHIKDVIVDFYGCSNYLISERGINKFKNSKKHKNTDKISFHYLDLKDFYSGIMGETLSFASAKFNDENEMLIDEAQDKRMDSIIENLNIKDGDLILDIGCGYHTLMCKIGEKYNIKGTCVLETEEEYNDVKKHIKDKGLEEKIEVRLLKLKDLRKLKNKYDKIILVESFEYIRPQNYPKFFSSIKKLLQFEGILFIECLSTTHEEKDEEWMKKYIAREKTIPSVRDLVYISSENSLSLYGINNITEDYIKTLDVWIDNLYKNKHDIIKLYGKKFFKMWEVYLCAILGKCVISKFMRQEIIFKNC